MKANTRHMAAPHLYVTVDYLGRLLFLGGRGQRQALAARLVNAGMASWAASKVELFFRDGAPQTCGEAEQLLAALEAAERLRQEDDNVFTRMSGSQLDHFAQDHGGMHRVTGETDWAFRARIIAELRGL